MGKVILSGIVPKLTVPVTDILASDLAVGSTVKLLESGTAVEYLVVNKGIPSGSSLYDSSCDGLWLLRKDILAIRKWSTVTSSSATNNYPGYVITERDVLALFDDNTKSAIKTVKIPHVNGDGYASVASGADGDDRQIFSLSGYEVGYTSGKVDGACLSYFSGATNSKRIAYLNGTATAWWTRTPEASNQKSAVVVTASGSISTELVYDTSGSRPALILPHTAKFDPETLLFKGVA